MKSYIAFTKKEFYEQLRTYKLLIMICPFVIFGMMSPLTAKIMPELMDSFMPEGLEITLADPVALDSWAQFFKNVSQMGLIILTIVYSGMMSNEFSKGTLINILTKGLPRPVVILSKYTMSFVIWTFSLWLSFFVTYGYTIYLWREDHVPNLFFSTFCMWVFGGLLLAVEVLGGVLFKSSYGSLLFTGGFVVLLFLINIIPKLPKYNPIALSSDNMQLLNGGLSVSDFGIPIGLGIGLIALCLALAVLIFNKKAI